jgi:hypothetical protein
MQRPHKRDAYRSLLKPAPVMSTIWMTSKTERGRESARERERETERVCVRGEREEERES